MKIGLKLTLSFLAVAVFIGIIVFYADSMITESIIKRNNLGEIKFSFEGQMGSFIGFVNGNNASQKLVTDSHTFIQDTLDRMINASSGAERDTLQKLKDLSMAGYRKKLNKNDPESTVQLIKKRDDSFREFLKKNNKHLMRVSEYKKFWGDEITNDKLTQLLININEERTLILDFDPNQEDFEKIRQEFRRTNDKVVQDLVSILVGEFDFYISAIELNNTTLQPLQSIKDALETQKNIAAQITATTFPAVTDKQAQAAGIKAAGGLTLSEAKDATVALGEACEADIVKLEESGIIPKERHDVKEVGENKNSIQVLISVIKCQQGLRINAEDFMNAKLAIKNQTDNFYMPVHKEFNEIIDGMISAPNSSFADPSMTIPILLIFAIAGIMVFGLFVSSSISRPIVKLTKASKRIKKGNLNSKIKVTSEDEIGELAETFNDMRLGLRDRNDLLNSLLKSFKGKLGKIAVILMRDDIQKLARKNPRIIKIIPKEMARMMEKSYNEK